MKTTVIVIGRFWGGDTAEYVCQWVKNQPRTNLELKRRYSPGEGLPPYVVGLEYNSDDPAWTEHLAVDRAKTLVAAAMLSLAWRDMAELACKHPLLSELDCTAKHLAKDIDIQVPPVVASLQLQAGLVKMASKLTMDSSEATCRRDALLRLAEKVAEAKPNEPWLTGVQELFDGYDLRNALFRGGTQ